MRKLIFHIDVNSAYLSWEAARRVANGEPDLRLIPSAIGGDPPVFQGDLRLMGYRRKCPERFDPIQQRLVQRQLLRLPVKEKQLVHRHGSTLPFRQSRGSMITWIASPSCLPRAERMAFVTPMR